MMEWISLLLSFVTGIGIGAIFVEIMRQKYENKKIFFETKLIKYSNLIEALQNFVSDGSSEVLKQKVVSAQKQVELIGNKTIISLSQSFYNSHANEFAKIRDDLVKSMQKDLKKYYSYRFNKNDN